MEKNLYERIDELKGKPTLTLSEINCICNEFDTDERCIDVVNAIVQYTSLTGNETDLTDFEVPNTKETWIEIAGALATEYFFMQPEVYTIKAISCGLDISEQEIISFLKLRNYIIFRNGTLFPTVLGIEKGYIINTSEGIKLTEKCEKKIRNAFTYSISEEEQNRVYALCKEAEKNMKSSSIGKAE